MSENESVVSQNYVHTFQEFVQLLASEQLLNHAVPDVDTAKTAAANWQITDLTFDSRKVQPGTLFICKGASFKEEYLKSAIAQGAVAYLSETAYDLDIPALIVSDVRKAMAVVARHFFDYPDEKLDLIGVTATKGKSTTVYMIKAVFDAALAATGKKPCGLLSGIEIFDGKITREAHLTTDESVELIRNLARCVENGLSHCVVEISSQALKYDRVAGINFATCSFINIGYDHISPQEHHDFADYFAAKLRITEHTQNFIYSAAMDHAAQVREKANHDGAKTYVISFASGKPDSSVKANLQAQQLQTDLLSATGDLQAQPVFLISDVQSDTTGSHFKVNGEPYTIRMPGAFNIENAAVAVACGTLAGFTPAAIAQGLRQVRVPGRSELTSTADGKLHCFVDYAHNTLSFEKALQSLRALYPDAYVIALFGAPGNKAYNRRKDLPCAAAKYADEIYLLPEDTGTEEIDEIEKELTTNIPAQVPYMVFRSREDGINSAFHRGAAKVAANPQAEFVYFIAGKGQETFMKIAGGYAPYIGDHEVVQQLIAAYDARLG